MERHFETGGGEYAAYRPDYPKQVVDTLATLTPRHEHAVDIGCGTGQLSVLLAERFARVTATDPSASQIANAETHERVRYRVGAAESIALPEGSADLVVAAQAAHWFELDAFYREAKRIARKDAVLALVTYGVTTMDGDLGARLHDFYHGEIHRFWPAGRRHIETEYRELDFPFEELSIAPLPLVREWSVDALLGYIGTWSASKRAREAGEGAILERFSTEFRKAWGESARTREIRWKIVIRAARLG